MKPFNDDMTSNAEWFRIERFKQHYSQGDIADRLGVTRSYISRVETGKRVMRLEMAVRYAEILGYPLSLEPAGGKKR